MKYAHIPGRLAGKSALVTGGGSGIGLATAQRLLDEGASVWLADLVFKEDSNDVVPNKSKLLITDVTVLESVTKAIQTVVKSEGKLDILVNTVGTAAPGKAYDTSIDTWDHIIKVNLTGTFNSNSAALAVMKDAGTGCIVNVSSDAGLVGMVSQAAYCSAKGGVVQFTRAAALDVAEYGVRVNCVCPCFIQTPLFDRWIEESPTPEQRLAEANAAQPIGRIGSPQEMAAAITFLASDEASFITGIALPVDGGVTAE